MRIAVVGTPRSGNTWVRSVLKGALELEELLVHDPDELPALLPERCILQLHWYREPKFLALLRREDFRVVTIARHPLDVLLSILHFSRYEPETRRWLGGDGALPDDLGAQSPASAAFGIWSRGPGAASLLSVGVQWWQDGDVLRLRYEDLVADPLSSFRAAIGALDGRPEQLEQFVAGFDLAYFRATANRHAWQGRPGLWRQLIPTLDAQRLRLRHRRVFDVLGYQVRPHLLTRAASDANWKQLQR